MVLNTLEGKESIPQHPSLFLIGIDEPSRVWTFLKAHELRKKGINVEVDYLGRSVKSQMREANRQKAQYVIVIGENELRTRTAKLKNMQTGTEIDTSLDTLEFPS